MLEKTALHDQPQKITLIVATILSLYPFIGMGVDLIAPSLPAISQNLRISDIVSKNLITVFLFGYALGNFLIGFLSDTLGRRKLLLVAFLIFTIASLLPIAIANTKGLLVARSLQGLAMGAFAVAGRATLIDILAPEKLIRVAPLFATMWGIGPIAGPIIGGYLQYYFGWRACFYFFAAFGSLGLVAAFFIIPETHFQRQTFNISTIKSNFVTIIKNHLFLGLVILMGLLYSLLIVFNTLGPFLIQTELGHSSVYFGHVALWMGVVFLAGTIICRFLIKRYKSEQLISVASLPFLLAALAALILAYLNKYSLITILFSTLVVYFSCGIMYPAAMSKGLSLFRHLAGSSAAVMNLINVLITSLTAGLMSFITANSAIPLAWIYVILLSLSTLAYFFICRQRGSGRS